MGAMIAVERVYKTVWVLRRLSGFGGCDMGLMMEKCGGGLCVGQETSPRAQRRDTYTQRLQHIKQRTSCHPGNDRKAVDRTHGETKVATLSWLSSSGSRRLQSLLQSSRYRSV